MTQHLGDFHTPVLRLVIFQNRRHGPSDGHAAAVQGMDEFRLGLGLSAEADVGAAGLVIFKITARGNFAVTVEAGEPHF